MAYHRAQYLYPDLDFSPTREYCLMEDSKFFGTRAQTNHVKMSSTAVIAVRTEAGETTQEVIEQGFTREEKYSYHSHLPSGHNASIHLEIKSTASTLDFQVNIRTDEGLEGLGSKKWKPAREISTGQVLAVILNKEARVIKDVREEPKQSSPIDLW